MQVLEVQKHNIRLIKENLFILQDNWLKFEKDF